MQEVQHTWQVRMLALQVLQVEEVRAVDIDVLGELNSESEGFREYNHERSTTLCFCLVLKQSKCIRVYKITVQTGTVVLLVQVCVR